MELDHKLVEQIIQRGIDAGIARKFEVACAVVDPEGRTRGVIRHADALWVTPEFAVGKARLASAFRNNTGPMFARLQKERPLYGATIAGLNAIDASRAEWTVMQQLKSRLPDADVTLREHRLSWRRDPTLPGISLYGVLVTRRVGPFILRREFAVPAR